MKSSTKCGMTQEEINEAFSGFQELMIEEDGLQSSDKDKCLISIKKQVSDTFFDEVLQIIDESGYSFDFKIESEPKGEYQTEPNFLELKGYYVSQTTDGGYSGDEFAGTVSIKCADGVFLEFRYQI